jgi:hypothetical protein
MLMVVGYPVEDVTVPDIERKPFEEIASIFWMPGGLSPKSRALNKPKARLSKC